MTFLETLDFFVVVIKDKTMWTFIRAGLDTSGANFSAVLQPKLINWVYGGLKLNTNTNQV